MKKERVGFHTVFYLGCGSGGKGLGSRTVGIHGLTRSHPMALYFILHTAHCTLLVGQHSGELGIIIITNSNQ